MTDDTDDKKVKDLIADARPGGALTVDAATRAELERWFGLPSFTEVEERAAAKPPEEDPEIVAVRERRQKVLEAVDPAMLEAHRRRTEAPDDLIKFKPSIEIRVDPDISLLDQTMIERGASIADPREVDIPEALRDDLHDCTPQALLRDLHRPELHFDKAFEVIDYAAENRVDIVGLVNEVMTATYKVSPESTNIFREGREILRELRMVRFEPWTEERLAALPNRRINR